MDSTILPRLFLETAQPDCVFKEADGFSCLEYRHEEKERKNRFIVSSYLFVMVLAGEKIIHSSDGEILLQAGEPFFAQKGSHIFSEIVSSAGGYHAAIFFIFDEFLGRFLRQHPTHPAPATPAPVPDVFRIKTSPLLVNGFESLLPYFHSPSSRTRELLGLKLEELLLLALDGDEDKTFHTFLHDLYSHKKQNILKVMEQYYTQPLAVADLAALSGRSLSAFKRDFRKLFRESPGQWVVNRRLKEAMTLLQNEEKTVSDTCFEVGFMNVSHFSRVFKKRYGYSPGQAKKSRKG